MDDDDERSKKHTIDTLFHVYCNHNVVSGDLSTQEYNSILLSQLDCWLEQAKLMPNPISRNQTGMIYMRYKKWRLEYEDFLEILLELSNSMDISIDQLKDTLLAAGPPTGVTEVVKIK